MNATRSLIRFGIGAAIVVGLVLLIAWWPKPSGEAVAGGDTWTCSMHPQIRLPNPGRCPICGMPLIPVSQLPKARGDLEMRSGLVTEPIQRRELFKEIRTVGKLDYSERQVAYISSRINGRVDRLFVDFTGVQVKKGDHLVEIYSPELLIAQRELLLGLDAHEREKKLPASERRNSLFAESTLESTRTKLRLLGILDEQIAEIEETRKATTHLTIFAPIGGTVIEKNVRLGQYLNTGDQVYRIADLDPIWLYLNIYEFDVAWVRFGQTVDVQLEAFPGETFAGSIMFIDPFLDDATRTIRVRVNIKNPDRLLKPQMFATATIHVKLRPDGSPEPTGFEGKFVCPMHPEIMQDEPGKCPMCAMPLEKVLERGPRGTRREASDEHVGHGVRASKSDASQDSKDSTAETPQPPKADEKSEHKDHAGHVKELVGKAESVEESAKPRDGVLAIPVSAVLDTGRRRITYRLTKEGAYELVDLKLGPRAHATDESGKRREYFVILAGINEGDHVVSQSGFLLDSQRQIEGMPSLLYPEGQAGGSLHSGHGGMDMGSKGGTGPKTDSKLAIPGGHQH